MSKEHEKESLKDYKCILAHLRYVRLRAGETAVGIPRIESYTEHVREHKHAHTNMHTYIYFDSI